MSTVAPSSLVDTRTYQDLVDETIARIPIHNPEWTNFNRSDPGVTLIELFAFLTESLLYRANQIPDRNFRAFLSLLGIPLQPATAASGMVTFSNDSGPRSAITLHHDLEVRAGQIPFRTRTGLDVLPLEARVYYKRQLVEQPKQLVDYYEALYASYKGTKPDTSSLQLYETVPLEAPPTQGQAAGVDLSATVDRSLWIALLLRRVDGTGDAALAAARRALAEKVLSLGIVPVQDDPDALLSPLGRSADETKSRLDYALPRVPPTGSLGTNADGRVAKYRSLDPNVDVNVLDEPGIVQLTLPDETGLTLWEDIDPLEAGVGELPPALDDTKLAARVITWLRIQATSGAQAKLLWAGLNAVMVSQRARALNEVLPNGTGRPDQVAQLSHSPVLPETVHVRVGSPSVEWTRLDDLYEAGPEVPVPDLRLPPGTPQPDPKETDVFTVDAAFGRLGFGDGFHGRRPPLNAIIRADYDYAQGRAGNVNAGAITSAPALPAGVKVTNPVRTWGGAEAESVAEGEKQIARYLQHRDRVVSAEDFDTIVRRTPGVDVGRVDVIPAWNPELSPSAPGDAPGAVTLMLIPRVDPLHPDAPQPDQPFLDAVCDYVDPRRLVTTEVFLRGPAYKPIWVSVGFDPVAGKSIAEVRDAVRAALLRFLAPLGSETGPPDTPGGDFPHAAIGWPRLKPVLPLELLAVASRVPDVDLVRPVLVAAGDDAGGADPVPMTGLELPLATVSVVAGDPLSLDQVRGLAPPDRPQPKSLVPVPIVPETC